jgi:hypothetical protein
MFFLPTVEDWIHEFHPLEPRNSDEVPIITIQEIVIFLEIKDWQEDQKVNADEIDKFVGKMIRGDATHGIFVAKTFSRSVKQVVRDHNAMLKKMGKSIEVTTHDSIRRFPDF